MFPAKIRVSYFNGTYENENEPGTESMHIGVQENEKGNSLTERKGVLLCCMRAHGFVLQTGGACRLPPDLSDMKRRRELGCFPGSK